MSKKMTLMMAAGTLVISTQVSGHANYVPKDNLDTYTGRTYKEGSSAYMNLNIAHSCKNDSGSGYLATRHVAIVFPNAEDLMGIAYTSNHGGDMFGGNAIMSIKPRVTRAFRKIKIINGDVPEFNSHGLKSRDVRGIHWKRGWVPNNKYEVLEFRATLPKLESASCVKKLRVYTPVVQYCTHDQKLAWMKAPTAMFGEEVISPNYAPYYDIIRDEENNPLPAGCSEDSMEMEVYPSDEDIDTYLILHKDQKPSGHPDNDNAGGHGGGMTGGGDNDNSGGHGGHGGGMTGGGDNDNSGGHGGHGGGMTGGGDNDNGGGHGGGMTGGGDNDNSGGHGGHGGGMTGGGDNDNSGGHGGGMTGGGDNDNGGGHGGGMTGGGDNDNSGGHGGGMTGGGDNDNSGGHGGGMTGGGDNDNGGGVTGGETQFLTEAELRGKANYVEYGCAASSCHGADPAMNEKNVLAGSDHVFFMATLDRVPEMQEVKTRLGDDHRTMLDINDYLGSFKK